MPFELPELPTDVDDAVERILDSLAEGIDGWEPHEGALEVALAEEIATEGADLATRAQEALAWSIAALGETAFGFPVYVGAPATIDAEVSVSAPGVVIEAGFAVSGVSPAGVEVAFTLPEDVLAGSNPQPVTFVCTEIGDVGNGVPEGPLTMITASTAVLGVEAVAASTNGADGETLAMYLDRFVDWAATLRPGGVRARDIAALTRTVPGVHRARAVDLYDVDDDAWGRERTVSVFPIDEDGAPVAGPVVAQVAQVLEDAREVNFIIRIGEPTYTPVEIVYAAIAKPGFEPVDVATAIEDRLRAWLGTFGTTEDDDQAWTDVNTIRLLEVVKVASSVDGVAYLTSLTINGDEADLVLPGVVPLPASPYAEEDPSTVTGTVS